LTIFLFLLTEELGYTILLGQTVVYTVPTLTLSYVVIILFFYLATWSFTDMGIYCVGMVVSKQRGSH